MQKWFMCRIYTHIDLRMKTKKEIHDKTIRLIPLSVAILLNILVLVLLSSLLVMVLPNQHRLGEKPPKNIMSTINRKSSQVAFYLIRID